MAKLRSGRNIGITLEPYMEKLKKPSIDYIYATQGYFRYCIRKPIDLLKFASIIQLDNRDEKTSIPTGFLVGDLHAGRISWPEDDLQDLKDWLNSNEKLQPWLSAQFSRAKLIVDPTIFLHHPPPSRDSNKKLQPGNDSMDKELIKKAFLEKNKNIRLFHFTDERNVPSIKKNGGILTLSQLRERGVRPIAPGGNQWSHDADTRIGLDAYVHLCFMDWHPMEFVARQEQRIETTTFLQIDPSVMLLDGVLFTPDVSNKAGVCPLTFEEAIETMDFSAVYGHLDWRDPEVKERRKAASKYELLIPGTVPLSLIRGI